jgi:hypothetical protein
MKLSTVIYALMLCSMACAQLDLQDDESERMKYGLSQAEWNKYKESGISKNKLEGLIRCGISINEYISRPWMTVGVSEDQWLTERCQGLNDEDIQAFHEKGESDVSIILSFVLPGFYHWKTKSYAKAAVFSTIFVSSIALYFGVTGDETRPGDMQANNQIGPPVTTPIHYPVFLVFTVADMVASAVFAYRDNRTSVQQQKDSAQEPAKTSMLPLRFEYQPSGNTVKLRYVYPF